MRRLLLVRLVVGIVAVSSVGACASNPPPRTGVVYAVREPPAERVEVVPVTPGTEYVWVKGHWGWRRNDYEWIPGHWVVPERGYREWVPGRWERDRHGWYFIEGHWR